MHESCILSSIKRNYLENIDVLKQVLKRGEKAMMSLKGLSYPKPRVGYDRGKFRVVPYYYRGG